MIFADAGTLRLVLVIFRGQGKRIKIDEIGNNGRGEYLQVLNKTFGVMNVSCMNGMKSNGTKPLLNQKTSDSSEKILYADVVTAQQIASVKIEF